MSGGISTLCQRCGIERTIKHGRPTTGLCRSCHNVVTAKDPIVVDPSPVQWERHGLIMRPVKPRVQRKAQRRTPDPIDSIARLVSNVVEAIEADRRRVIGATHRTTCPACDCLILADEPCPGCRATVREVA